nr:putative ribonuclease H-like domain-containing protein [Tanacetum cinerariifolium]
MVSSVKLPILKKGEYILWTIKMEHYLAHTDYALWEVILNESTNSTKELNVAYIVSTAISHSSQAKGSSSYVDELMRRLEFNGKELVGFDKTKVECFKYHRRGNFARYCRTAKNPRNKRRDVGNVGYRGRDNGKSPAREEDEKALVVQDGLGYNSHFNEKEVLNVKEEKVTDTVFDNRLSDEENSLANDRFKKGDGFHVVPPPLIGNYTPPKPDLSFDGLDDSIYKFKISETVTSLSKDVKDAFETTTAFGEKPKEVRTSAPLIEEWDTESDNESVFRPKHIPAKINFVKAGEFVKPVKSVKHVKPVKPVNTAEQTEKSKNFSSSPKVDKKLEWENDLKTGDRPNLQKAYPADYQEINGGGFVAFGSSRGKITRKGKIRTEKLDFDDVYFVNELKFNHFSVSQMCDKKTVFCLLKLNAFVLSPNFKLLDESQVLLRVPRQSNIYSFDLQNVVPSRNLTSLFPKASIDESNLWHRRLGLVNFKTMNKLVKGNLVRGLRSKIFENNHTCVACQKGKQPKATYKRCYSQKFALLLKRRRRNCQSKIDGSYIKIVPQVLPMILAVTVNCNIMYKDSLYYKRSPLGLVEGVQVSKNPSF